MPVAAGWSYGSDAFPVVFPIAFDGGRMALPNFELYESLKKDLSEESARMIAEVVPQAADLATRDYIDQLEARLKSYIDSRLLRYTATIVVPMVITMLGTIGALIALVVKI